MLILIVWMQMAGGPVLMTAQPVYAHMCGEMRQAFMAEPDTEIKTLRASCMGNPESLPYWIKKGNCYVAQEARNFTNFICTKPGEWYAVKN